MTSKNVFFDVIPIFFCPFQINLRHSRKENIIKNKLIPAFGKRIISEIDTKDIIAWQNELLAYRDEQKKPYSNTYLKVIHNQMVSILNHAVRHYGLKSNPASKVGYIGSKESEEMQFWTKEEYEKFSVAMMDKPMSYYAFEMLYCQRPRSTCPHPLQ